MAKKKNKKNYYTGLKRVEKGVESCDLNSGPWMTSPRGGGGSPEGAPVGGTSIFLHLLCPPRREQGLKPAGLSTDPHEQKDGPAWAVPWKERAGGRWGAGAGSRRIRRGQTAVDLARRLMWSLQNFPWCSPRMTLRFGG